MPNLYHPLPLLKKIWSVPYVFWTDNWVEKINKVHLIIIHVFPDYRNSNSLAHELPGEIWDRARAAFFNGCHVTVYILILRQKCYVTITNPEWQDPLLWVLEGLQSRYFEKAKNTPIRNCKGTRMVKDGEDTLQTRIKNNLTWKISDKLFKVRKPRYSEEPTYSGALNRDKCILPF